MRTHLLVCEQLVAAELDEVFHFFAQAHNLQALTPPWLSFTMLTPEPIEMHEGTLIDYGLRLHGVPIRWRSRIDVWEPGRAFVDRQIRGPYRLWHHRHEFRATAEGTLVLDTVRYGLPLGPVGELALPLVRRDLARIFAYRRRQVTARLAS